MHEEGYHKTDYMVEEWVGLILNVTSRFPMGLGGTRNLYPPLWAANQPLGSPAE